MKILLTILFILLGVSVLYCLLVMGRRNHPGLVDLQGWSYAHRGLHGNGRPENSMAAFRAALDHGYGIELDVHLTRDGQLVVIHDHSLLRTAGADVKVEELTLQELSAYRLEGTQEPIPTFRQVLELFDGKAPMIVELKAIDNNHALLTDKVVEMLAAYPGVFCIESFDPRCILHLRKHYKHIVRGQLTQNFLATKGKIPWILKFVMTHQLGNFLLLPDFVAYRFSDRKTVGNFLVRKLWGVQGVTWTLRSPEEHAAAVREGWIPIFENYEPNPKKAGD